MGRTINSVTLASRITVFPYKAERGSYVLWTGDRGVSSKLVSVTALVGHTYLYRGTSRSMALQARAVALAGIEGRNEQHKRILTNRGVKRVVAVGTFSYIIPIWMIRIIDYTRAIDTI
jgi:hypothetical protein